MKTTRTWIFVIAGLVALAGSLNASVISVENSFRDMTTVADNNTPPTPPPGDPINPWILR